MVCLRAGAAGVPGAAARSGSLSRGGTCGLRLRRPIAFTQMTNLDLAVRLNRTGCCRD